MITFAEVEAAREKSRIAKELRRGAKPCTTCPPGLCPTVRTMEADAELAEKVAESAVARWIAQGCREVAPPEPIEIDPRRTVEYWQERCDEAEAKLREIPCVLDAHAQRDALPERIADFIRRTWGEKNLTDRWERTTRVLEEAIELAQAEGLTDVFVKLLVSRVFDRSPGDANKEAGDVGVTLLAWCYAAGVKLDDLMNACHERIEKIDPEKLREKQREKFRAGFGIDVECPPGCGCDGGGHGR